MVCSTMSAWSPKTDIVIVFLGADNSVKLGDFGLSKAMSAQDLASTYVGTPFYMSPEISAGKRYTLKSDIWSLGCIIYELCAREPPFNAKTHFQLIQKIKDGVFSPIPRVYSAELMGVIKDCLMTNPNDRPDTASLLNLPVVKLMRKEKEVVELARIVKSRDEAATQRLREAEERLKKVEADKVQWKVDIEASVRREWEVKARLEIDRIVQLEIEKLQKRFESEVQERVETIKNLSFSIPTNDIPLSSVSTCDLSSTTDITEYSTDSPEPTKTLKKSTRTPFTRAQTMFAGTPMDIEMAEPSPMSIASLSLSPRRHDGTKAPIARHNIFAAAGEPREQWRQILTTSDSEDEDNLPAIPSPTQQRSKTIKNPFKALASRPPLLPQMTAPFQKPVCQTNTLAAATAKSDTANNPPTIENHTNLGPAEGNMQGRCPSPSRHLSKIPSSTCLGQDRLMLLERKPSFKKGTASNPESSDLNKLAIKNNMAIKASAPPRGRTLIELAQARAGGRPAEANGKALADGSPKGKKFAERMAYREAATWDPERDEMPSPFLVRKKAPVQRA